MPSTRVRLVAFAAAVVVAFGIGAGVGNAVGPLADDAPAHSADVHEGMGE